MQPASYFVENEQAGKPVLHDRVQQAFQPVDVETNRLIRAPAARFVESEQPGKAVLRQCIDCDVCRETTPEEVTLCEEAFMACPVEAIGDDGV